MSKPIRSAGYRSATYVVSPLLGAAQGELPEGQERVPMGDSSAAQLFNVLYQTAPARINATKEIDS